MNFESLALCEPLLRNLKRARYTTATPIQEQAIPIALEGRDVVGCAQTGTGKTAAFTLPTLHRLYTSTTEHPTTQETHRPNSKHHAHRSGKHRRSAPRRAIRSLIVTPTRELAAQIGDSLATYGRNTNLRHTVVYGGVKQGSQVRELQAGVDTLVATPGRLLDLIGQGYIDLSRVEVLILDEADQMLDMGFIHDMRRIVQQVPKRRQTLMFSATMPPQVRELADQWLRDPHEVRVSPAASTPDRVSQSVCFVDKPKKLATLERYLHETTRSRTLIFSRTKRGADKIARSLQKAGFDSVSIHGDKSQAKRRQVMKQFNSQRPPILVATDLASRGLDFTHVSHVINYDIPETPESYVHRIGRTARAGASGQAFSLCGRDERCRLKVIEKLIGQSVPEDSLCPTTRPKQRDEQRHTPKRPRGARVEQESVSHGRPKKKRFGKKYSKPNGSSSRTASSSRNASTKSSAPKRREKGGVQTSSKTRSKPARQSSKDPSKAR